MTIRHVIVDQLDRIHEVTNMYDITGNETTDVDKAESGVALINGKAWQVFSTDNVDIHTVQ